MSGKMIEPEGWQRGRGYSHGVLAEGRVLTLAGQVGWDPKTQTLVSGGFMPQARQALANLAELLRTAGAKPEDVVRVTWFITGRKQYMDVQRELGEVWREHFGTHYPAMSVIIVAALVEPGAMLEIEAMAVVGS